MVTRSYPGKHEQLWGADSSSGEDNFISLNSFYYTISYDLNTYGLCAFEQDTMNGTVCFDTQICPFPYRWCQVGYRYALADPV